MQADVMIIGGGIAGLQASIQLGRYARTVTVIDEGRGRSSLCRQYRNLLGWPDGVSGRWLREAGREHAGDYGVDFIDKKATRLVKEPSGFQAQTEDGKTYRGKKLILATGVTDANPFPELEHCFGMSVYICPDCDGYEIKGKRTLVLGSGSAGVGMALELVSWTDRLTYVNHGNHSVATEEEKKQLSEAGIRLREGMIDRVHMEGDQFTGVTFGDGEELQAEKAFIAFPGNVVHSDLAKQIGVERLENHHVLNHYRTKMTNIRDVWAAGDIAVHSEQVAIAMGEGTQAAVWVQRTLLQDET
ncbi:NAD(P)/FAD-dependent oxidoreductase [Salicibibacter kimchii]|uniref:NAD(P)/FAD-dependent oxidoreductase n=1 Tax=Salicibibacter kimchii TaxID=2099786 RepID=A0A345BZ21_9BACI|nr:NAD(P)/FAD-dependent oxidoreductase [Salicibibacter kimchii]AXF56202.1 NAD(P)/FAD-dependent oxidoreductase [Salicibibacter kimchii]